PQFFKPIAADGHAEILAGDVLHLVRLVEYGGVIFRQDPACELVVLQRQIGKEEVMVDDDDVALLRPLVHEGEEAALELLALLPAAQIAPRVQLRPSRALLRQRLDFGAVAEFGGLFPFANDLEVGGFLEAGQDRLPVGVVDFLAAGVVAAAFHVTDLKWTVEMLLQKRDIFEEELLLQILGTGGHHNTLAGQNGGNQGRQRLPPPSAGLDDEVVAIVQRRFDRLRHLELPGAKFVVRMPPGKCAVTLEKVADRGSSGLGGHSGDTSILLSRVFNATSEKASQKSKVKSQKSKVWRRASL